MSGVAAAVELERVARLSYGRLLAVLAARLGSLADAEDALGEALLRALRTWPRTGVPDAPEAWLLTVARRRAIDGARVRRTAERWLPELEMLERERGETPESAFPDGLLALMFVCAHPSIEPRVRAPLMLQAVLGLDVRRMAGVFLVSPGTLGQRLVRAKAKIARAGIPFEVPSSPVLETRLDDVLAAVYGAYSVGFDGPAGDVKTTTLTREAIWLAGQLCRLVPDEPEAHGLLALMLFAEARRPARAAGANGRFVPLERQDTGLWDTRLLEEAEHALRSASRRGGTLRRYQLEASIHAVHAARRTGGETDWNAILLLYEGLVRVSPTVGAQTGRAAALAEVHGAEAGLAALEAIEPTKRRLHQPWWAVRAHLAALAGRYEAAREAYGRAAGLTDDIALRRHLLERRSALPGG